MADDDGGVSLPPSVSDGDLPPDVLSEEGPGSDVSLPCPALGTKCVCKKMCYEKVSLQAVRDFRQEHLNLSGEDRARQVFAVVDLQVYDRDGQVKPGRTKLSFQGVRVCQPFWEYAHATGHAGVDMARECLEMGADGPPERLSRIPPGMSKFVDADAWLLNIYQSVGEPLAEVDHPFF